MSEQKPKFIMVQGTMSSAGKSLMVAGLCRIFRQDGFRAVPFKSQNMALNSFITEDGLEMGRAQVMQAEAAGVKPSVYMNPILLKPTDDVGSQIIVNGKVIGNMRARDYFAFKKQLIPDILAAVEKLGEEADIIVIEGAGSPAEINLRQNDIVNMGMAELVDAPVLLVGDIDRGGVFAQLLGTVELLQPEERGRVKGLIVNKFRGDKTILDPGIVMLEERCGIPVAGVIPYMDLNLEDEDSLTERFERRGRGKIDIAVLRVPHVSNFTDFNAFDEIDSVGVRYVRSPRQLGEPDLLILPGSKSTIADLKWLRESGMETAVKKYVAKGKPVLGICGGYQMLGDQISDPTGAEGGGSIRGLGLLPVCTVLQEEKHRSQTEGCIEAPEGLLAPLAGKHFAGYEIHMGVTTPLEGSTGLKPFTSCGTGVCSGNIYGSYIHGLFDTEEVLKALVQALAEAKGVQLDLQDVTDFAAFKEKEYDRLAQTMREYMDMDLVYGMMGMERP